MASLSPILTHRFVEAIRRDGGVRVFIHELSRKTGPPTVHDVCGHIICVTLIRLFPSLHVIDTSQFFPQ